MRRLVPIVVALATFTGCRSLSTTASEPIAFGPDEARRFDRATVVVYTGRGDRTRRVVPTDVDVRPDSTLWSERVTHGVTRTRRRAVTTPWVREVITTRPAPQVGKGVLNGLLAGGLAGGALSVAGAWESSSAEGAFVGLMVVTGATTLCVLFGIADGAQAKAYTHHRLSDTPPGR